MPEPFDLELLPPPARRLLGAEAPKPAKLMAAKGIIPGLKPGDIVTVLALLADDPDAAVARTANETLGKLPPPILNGALGAQVAAVVMVVIMRAPSARCSPVARVSAGGIMPMPGQPRGPSAQRISLNDEGMIIGLS